MTKNSQKHLLNIRKIIPTVSIYFGVIIAMFIFGMVTFPYSDINYSININKSLNSFSGTHQEHNLGKFETATLRITSNMSLKIELIFVPFQYGYHKLKIINHIIGPTNTSFTQKQENLFLRLVSNQNKSFELLVSFIFSGPGKLVLEITPEFNDSPNITSISLEIDVESHKNWHEIAVSFAPILKWLVGMLISESIIRTGYTLFYSKKQAPNTIDRDKNRAELLSDRHSIVNVLSGPINRNKKDSISEKTRSIFSLSKQLVPANYVLMITVLPLTLFTDACKFPDNTYINENMVYDFINLVSSTDFLSVATFSLIFNVFLLLRIFNYENEELYPLLSYPLPKTSIILSWFTAGSLSILALFVPWFAFLYYFRYNYFLGIEWSSIYKEYLLLSIYFIIISTAQLFLLLLIQVFSKNTSLVLVFSLLILFLSRIITVSNKKNGILFVLSLIYPPVSILHLSSANGLAGSNSWGVTITIIWELVFSVLLIFGAIFYVKTKKTTLLREDWEVES